MYHKPISQSLAKTATIAVLIALVGNLRTGAAVLFHGIGDLPGGIVSSEARDATKVGNVLHVVGGSSSRDGSTGSDTAVLWTSTGGLVALPNFVTNLASATAVFASAITPDGHFIAGRLRSSPSSGLRSAARTSTADLSSLNFGALVGAGNSAANAISSDGSVLYGFANGLSQAARFTTSGPTGTLIPYLYSWDTSSIPAGRGSSADGSVMIGTSSNPTNSRAFRYVHGSGVTALPLLPGGSWSKGSGVSPDGKVAWLIGNSSHAPAGEVYSHDSTTGTLTAFGTPDGGVPPDGLLGATPDGSVIVATFLANNPGASTAFFRNANGWHELQAALLAGGATLTGWTMDHVTGISPDATLIWGTGVHNGNPEGWVAELPAGLLAGFAEPKLAAAVGQDVAGAWFAGDTASSNLTVFVFCNNGYYLHIEDDPAEVASPGVSGFERGRYTWNPKTGACAFQSLNDQNGDLGPGGINGLTISVSVVGNQLTAVLPGETNTLTRVTGADAIVGSWLKRGSDIGNGRFTAFVFLADGSYLMVQEGPPQGGGYSGIERGTYTWNPANGNLTSTTLFDNNGAWGLNSSSLTVTNNGDVLNGEFDRVKGASVILQPTVHLNDRSQCGFTAYGVTGQSLVLQGSADLVNWAPLATNQVVAGSADFLDPQIPPPPNRSYRLQTRQ